eukprot:997511-Rhodomonas_salina.2
MFIAVGPMKRRLQLHAPVCEETLVDMCRAHEKSFQSVFLEFGDGLFIPLLSDQQRAMAVRMVCMHVALTANYDDDGWIEEAQEMEAKTEEHMLASSSESEREDDDEVNAEVWGGGHDGR